jgi:S1-C subfamily serine protease
MTAPKLQATFREEAGRLLFTGFGKDSPAQAAGLKTGDALLALDGRPAGALEDVKLMLFTKQQGDILLVTVARKRFLLGEKVMTVEVRL